MKTNVFLEKLQEALEQDVTLTAETRFADLDNFDSMSIMILIAFVDENFNHTISAKQFVEIENVRDLMNLIGTEHFG